jgi:hypothetical protein
VRAAARAATIRLNGRSGSSMNSQIRCRVSAAVIRVTRSSSHPPPDISDSLPRVSGISASRLASQEIPVVKIE